MKIQFIPQELQAQLKTAFTCAPTRGHNPLLMHVKMVVEKGHVSLHATSVDMGMRIETNATGVEDGKALLPKSVLDVLKTVPKKEQLTMETVENGIAIYDDNIRREMVIEKEHLKKIKDFPGVAGFDAETFLEVSAGEFVRMIDRTVPMVDSNNVKYALGNVCFNTTLASRIEAVATCGLQLVWQPVLCVEYGEHKFDAERGILVPPAALTLLEKAIKNEDKKVNGSIKIAQIDKTVCFQYGAITFFTRLNEGRYPGWQQIIPATDNVLRADISGSALLNAFKFVEPVISKIDPCVILDFAPDKLTLTVDSKQTGKTVTSLPITCNGTGTVSVRPKPIITILKTISGDIQWTMDGENPLMFTTSDECRFVAMRIRSLPYTAEVDGIELGEKIRQEKKTQEAADGEDVDEDVEEDESDEDVD